jgi:hypothetical protein
MALPYHPSVLLGIYIYGYLNRIQSSRRLERETQRNIELMWLTGRLTPDFKTIADFRKDSGVAIRSVCRQFILICQRLDMFDGCEVAIDGSKFKAVNNLPSSAADIGASMVRLASRGMADTNTATDWTFVNFSTPAATNDVAPGVIDSDDYGIPDTAKVSGGTYGGLDLYAMGARAGRRDIFVEIDHMPGFTGGVCYPSHVPRAEALQKVVKAFAAKNIAIHFDTGNLGGGNEVPYHRCLDLSYPNADPGPDCTSFYDYKARHFDLRRSRLFHYAIFANYLKTYSLAQGTVSGRDLVVAVSFYGTNGTEPGTLQRFS